MGIIFINNLISIDDREILETYTRASGPGGQNINKVATAVQLRFNVALSPELPEEVLSRLIRLAGKRMTNEGVLVIDARRYRTLERNRQDARDRLIALIRRAAEKPKKRRKTQPSQAERQKRLENKLHRSRIKRLRQRSPGMEE